MRGLIFDLDGTLIDTVYAHVLAWQQSLAEMEMYVPAWQIHRRVGMGVSRFVRLTARELGRGVSPEEIDSAQKRWREIYAQLLPAHPPVPGAVELLRHLHDREIPHGITTGSQRPEIDASLEALGVGAGVPIVEGTEVSRGKPEPDIFLACQERLGLQTSECYVVGDGVHDLLAARRAGMFGLGVLTGGQREDELYRAGAFRVYRDPEELRLSLDELGFSVLSG